MQKIDIIKIAQKHTQIHTKNIYILWQNAQKEEEKFGGYYVQNKLDFLFKICLANTNEKNLLQKSEEKENKLKDWK